MKTLSTRSIKLQEKIQQYHNAIKAAEGRVARSYLITRGILESVDDFLIGYAPEGYFANRVTFPVIDIHGVPQNITSRLIGSSKTEKSHLHLPKVKMDWFFNERALISEEDPYIIICESPIDCITLSQAGFNAVACMGANNLNRGKLEKVKHFPEVFICFDNDINESGQKASRRAGKLACRLGARAVYNIAIPFLQGPDVNAMYVKNPKGFISSFNELMRSAHKFVVKDLPPKREPLGYKIGEYDIVGLAEQYVELYWCGPSKYKAVCPLHEETKPSFYIDEDKGRWICFGCGKGGDAIDLIRALNEKKGTNMSFKEAIEYLSKFHNNRRST